MSKNEELKKNATTAASSAIGAAAGVVAGAAMAAPGAEAAEAAEATVDGETPEVEIPEAEVSDVEATVMPTPAPAATQPATEQPVNAEVEIVEIEADPDVVDVDYETEPQGHGYDVIETGVIELADGTTADAAILDIDGTAAMIVDFDHDGKADMAAIDFNQNGQIDDDEIIDTTGHDIPMPSVEDCINSQGDLYAASDDTSDFVNDADAGMYMA